MEQFNNSELEYFVDDYYDEFDDDPTSENGSSRSADFGSADSDVEDDFESVCFFSS